MMKTRIFLTIAVAIMIASCGTKKELVEAPTAIQSPAIQSPAIPPPAGIEVMNTTTKVFASLNLPKNDNWVIKNEDATWRPDEFLVKKMDEYKTISVIRTMSLFNGDVDLNDTVAILKSINANATMLLGYNDYHFKKDGNGDAIETPVYTTKITNLSNNIKVVLMEAELKITNTNYKTYGYSYYARNYFILANREDGKKCIPVVFSSTVLTPDNYAVEKQNFIELVDYVANTAVVKPEYKFEN